MQKKLKKKAYYIQYRLIPRYVFFSEFDACFQ